MPDTPLDKLEIKITSSSSDAEKKVNDLANALERLSNMSSLKGVEEIAEKVKLIGNVRSTISVSVDHTSTQAVDGLIERVNALQRAIEQVNATAINVQNLPRRRGSGSTSQTGQVAETPNVDASGAVDVAAGSVEKVTARVGVLQRAFEKLRALPKTFSAETLRATSEGAAALDNMKTHLFTNMTIWGKIKVAARSALDSIKDGIAAAATNVKALGVALRGAIPIIGSILVIGKKLLGFSGTLLGAFKKLTSTIAGGLVNGIKKIGSGLKTIGGNVLNYVTKPFQRAIGFIENFKKKLVSVAFYRLVRTALKMITDGFKEGIENLYYFSSLTESQFKPAMDSLASSSLYLKNSLGAMAAPLIQSVAPAVNYLIDLFVSLLNVINMVFSVLGGRTYTKALKTSAKYADDLDKSLGGGASSAKELQRYLIGIDQLTIMPDEPNRGGGGGGGADIGSMYEEMFEEVPLPDWVLNIKDAINQGDWTGAGELLAEKVNSLIDKLKENAKTWGRNIGQAVQRGIELSLGFIRKVDIEGVGESITTLIGNALEEINPRDLGAIIASKIKSAFRFVSGLLEGYTGPDIGAYLAEVVNGWFAELRRDNGWKQAAEDLSQVIKGIINGVSSFLENLDTASIEQDLRDFFGNIDWDGIWSSLKTMAQVAADKIPWKDMFNGLLRVAANALVFVHDTILKIPSTQATSGVWGTLISKIKDGEPISFMDILSGLSAFFGDVVDYITDMIPESGWGGIWDTIKENLAGALTNGGSWDDLKEQLKGVLVGVIGGALEIAADSLYSAISDSHPWIAGWLFPGAKNKAYQGAMSGSTNDKLGYLLENNPAAGLLVPGRDDILAGLGGGGQTNGSGGGRKVTIDFDATETKAYKTAIKDYRNIGDKKSRMDLSATNRTPGVFTEANRNWSTITTKNATLSAFAKNVNAVVLSGLTSAWKSLNNKTATLTGAGAKSQSLIDVVNTYNAMKNKNSTVTVLGNSDTSFNNVRNTFNSVSNKNATLTAYAQNKDPSILGTLRGAWETIKSKTVTLTANIFTSASNALKKLFGLESGGIYVGGSWHDIAGYAGGGSPKRARLFYANENGIPELVGHIGGNTAVMNNGQIVASVSSGVYRAVSAAMGGLGNYFANIATGMSRIPEVLSNITPVQPQPILVGASGPSYEMDMSVIGRSGYDGTVQRGQEDQEEIINAIYAMGQRIISAINDKDTNLYFDTQRVGSSTTDVQNRQNRMYGKTLSNG